MKDLIVVKCDGARALPEGGGAVRLETQEGSCELRFTFEDAERLIAALQRAREEIQGAREKNARPPLPEPPRIAERWQTGIDPINQVARLEARLPDGTLQQVQLSRQQIPGIARFLAEALTRFESSADMRQ